MAKEAQTNPHKSELRLSLDYRLLSVILVLIIVGMIGFWRPWEGVPNRTIEVSGEAIVKAVPDEFVFYPNYEFTNADKDAALKELAAKSESVVAKLKELGVSDSQIKTNGAGGYDYTGREPESPSYTLSLTVTVSNQELAQRVQDYLVTTTPSGAVTPQAQFSRVKQDELERQARDEATKDARAKAEQSARNLGFSLGAVKSVTDGSGFGGIPFSTGRGLAEDLAVTKLTIQPGENELTYMVTVVYFVR
jgi:uncharacterized protein YggE